MFNFRPTSSSLCIITLLGEYTRGNVLVWARFWHACEARRGRLAEEVTEGDEGGDEIWSAAACSRPVGVGRRGAADSHSELMLVVQLIDRSGPSASGRARMHAVLFSSLTAAARLKPSFYCMKFLPFHSIITR